LAVVLATLDARKPWDSGCDLQSASQEHQYLLNFDEFWILLDRFGICFSYNLRIPAVSELLPPLRVSHQDLALYHGVSRTAEGARNLIGIPLLSAAPSAPSVYISSSEN